MNFSLVEYTKGTFIFCDLPVLLSLTIYKLLKRVPNVKIVLLHGGDIELMSLVQLARFNSNNLNEQELAKLYVKYSE